MPRHLQQVLLGETLTPADEEGGNGTAVAIGKSATTLVTFGTLDKEASGFVFESRLLSIPAGRGGIERSFDALIVGQSLASSVSVSFSGLAGHAFDLRAFKPAHSAKACISSAIMPS